MSSSARAGRAGRAWGPLTASVGLHAAVLGGLLAVGLWSPAAPRIPPTIQVAAPQVPTPERIAQRPETSPEPPPETDPALVPANADLAELDPAEVDLAEAEAPPEPAPVFGHDGHIARAHLDRAALVEPKRRRTASAAPVKTRVTLVTRVEPVARIQPVAPRPDDVPPPTPQPPSSARAATDAQPLADACPPPDYPRVARQRGWEGRARIGVAVDADGTVTRVWLVESSGRELLDRAALRAVRSWRFRPGTEDGHAVPDEVIVPIRFRLN